MSSVSQKYPERLGSLQTIAAIANGVILRTVDFLASDAVGAIGRRKSAARKIAPFAMATTVHYDPGRSGYL